MLPVQSHFPPLCGSFHSIRLDKYLIVSYIPCQEYKDRCHSSCHQKEIDIHVESQSPKGYTRKEQSPFLLHCTPEYPGTFPSHLLLSQFLGQLVFTPKAHQNPFLLSDLAVFSLSELPDNYYNYKFTLYQPEKGRCLKNI